MGFLFLSTNLEMAIHKIPKESNQYVDEIRIDGFLICCLLQHRPQPASIFIASWLCREREEILHIQTSDPIV